MVFDAIKSESISLTFYKQLLHQYYYEKKLQSQTASRETLRKTLVQRCPTLSPFATCGDRDFNCGDKHNFFDFIVLIF